MTRKPLGYCQPNPRLSINFLDSCAFDPKYSPEHESAQLIRALCNDKDVIIAITHSNQKEIDHPNTPLDVKIAADCMIYTVQTNLIPEEVDRKNRIHLVLTGNGNPEKYAADAEHIFGAGKHGGYFITTDDRILKKKIDLENLSNALILKPSEWLNLYNTSDKI